MLNIKENISLRPYNTFKLGGEAEFFVVIKSEEELLTALSEAQSRQQPVTILGGGSNIIVPDTGIKGLVIKNEIGGIEYREEGDRVFVTVGSGVVWDDLVSETVSRNLWGMENLSSIPGTVGATPIQNVGAYGVEVSDLISELKVYDKEKKEFKIMSLIECEFSYRDSFFKTEAGKNFIIISVTFILSKVSSPKLDYKDLQEKFSGQNPSVSEVRDAVVEIRKNKFPNLKEVGTAGSFFKNPIISGAEYSELLAKYPNLPGFIQPSGEVKVSLGWILDKVCNLKGFQKGSVATYKNQSLVLVNYGDATTEELLNFAKEISDLVFEKTKIRIEIEPNIL